MFAMSPKKVREHCHAKGQRFAFQPVENGNILIDLKKYEEFLKVRTAEHLRRIR
jgi:hypothetical protein